MEISQEDKTLHFLSLPSKHTKNQRSEVLQKKFWNLESKPDHIVETPFTTYGDKQFDADLKQAGFSSVEKYHRDLRLESQHKNRSTRRKMPEPVYSAKGLEKKAPVPVPLTFAEITGLETEDSQLDELFLSLYKQEPKRIFDKLSQRASTVPEKNVNPALAALANTIQHQGQAWQNGAKLRMKLYTTLETMNIPKHILKIVRDSHRDQCYNDTYHLDNFKAAAKILHPDHLNFASAWKNLKGRLDYDEKYCLFENPEEAEKRALDIEMGDTPKERLPVLSNLKDKIVTHIEKHIQPSNDQTKVTINKNTFFGVKGN